MGKYFIIIQAWKFAKLAQGGVGCVTFSSGQKISKLELRR